MSFDAYQEWFGIPENERPPTFYQLLGVEIFETDPDKLHQGALMRIAHLRKFQAGKNSDLSQQLMNEVSHARIVLLDPIRRLEYDARLRMDLGEPAEDPFSNRSPKRFSSVKIAALITVSLLLLVSSVAFLTVNWSNPGDTSLVTAQLETGESARTKAAENRLVPPAVSKTSPTPKANIPAAVAEKQPTPPEVATTSKPDSKVDPMAVPTVFDLSELQKTKEPQQLVDFTQSETAAIFAGFPADRAHRDHADKMLTVTLVAGQQQTYFFPVPGQDFRLLMLADLSSLKGGQSVSLGAFSQPTPVLDLTVQRVDEKTCTVIGKTVETGLKHSVHGNRMWVELSRQDKLWRVSFSDNRRTWATLAEAPDITASLLGLTLDNSATTAKMVLPIRHFCVETASPEYASLLPTWPEISPQPPSEILQKLFSGKLLRTSSGLDRIQFTPDHASSVAVWSATANEDATSMTIVAPQTVGLGPLTRITHVHASVRLQQLDTVMSLLFASGGRIEFDFAKQQVVLPGGKTAPISMPVGQWIDITTVRTGDGNFTVTVNDNTSVFENVVGLEGPLEIGVQGTAAIDVQKIEVDGVVDIKPLWMAAIAGTSNALTTAILPEPVPEPLGAYKVLGTVEGTAKPWDLAVGVPVPLTFLNTEMDENFPSLESDGRTLHFSRSSEETGTKLYAGFRPSLETEFTELRCLNGLPDFGSQYSISFAPDRLRAVYCSNHETSRRLYFSKRESEDHPLELPVPLSLFAEKPGADCRAPFWAPNGSLYFSHRLDGGTMMFRSDPDAAGLFGEAKPEGLDANFAPVCLLADNRTLFLQGPDRNDRQNIYRTLRKTPATRWFRAATVKELRDDSGKRGAVSPYVTPDGKYLFFASDREGGKGGLDLWVVKLLPDSADEKQAETEQVSRVPVTKTIDEWLTVGPIDPRLIPDGNHAYGLKAFLPTRLFRDTPKLGEEIGTLHWTLGKPQGKPGVYIVSLPLDLETPTELMLQVDHVPGGAFFWLGGEPMLEVFEFNPFKSSGKVDRSSKPVKKFRGKHRVLGVVCVIDPQAELRLNILDAQTGQPPKGLFIEMPKPTDTR